MLYILFIFIGLSHADALEIGSYRAEVVSVYDGDTIKANVDIWVGMTQFVSIRIRGIDAPEIRTKNECEKMLAIKSKRALIDFIGDNKAIISNVKLGKYAGRVIADVSINGKDVADYMVKHGYARKYDGGKRVMWCDAGQKS